MKGRISNSGPDVAENSRHCGRHAMNTRRCATRKKAFPEPCGRGRDVDVSNFVVGGIVDGARALQKNRRVASNKVLGSCRAKTWMRISQPARRPLCCYYGAYIGSSVCPSGSNRHQMILPPHLRWIRIFSGIGRVCVSPRRNVCVASGVETLLAILHSGTAYS